MGCYVLNLWHSLYQDLLKIIVAADSSAGRTIWSRIGVGKVRHLDVKQIYVQKLVAPDRVILVKEEGTVGYEGARQVGDQETHERIGLPEAG